MSNFKCLEKYFLESIAIKTSLLKDPRIKKSIIDLSNIALKTLKSGGKIILAGNGGSFADAQHISAEFVSRFMFERGPLAALTLGTNSSNISAIGNDYGYENIFSRELKVLGYKKDLFIPISTSGNSVNIINAVKTAIDQNINCFGLTGSSLSELSKLIKCVKVPSQVTAHIQECHIMIGHYMCMFVEKEYFKND
jgi:D-sedoheptulose 7-phosphate isomerase